MRFATMLSLSLALVGCDGCGEEPVEPEPGASEEAAFDPSTIEVPSDLLMEACAGSDRAALQEALGPTGSAALISADTRAALAEVSEAVTPHASHVEPRATMCALSFRSEEGDARLVVAPLARPIEGGDEGAPADGRWLADSVAVIGDAVVVGADRSLVEHAGAYAALRLLPAEREATMTVTVPDGVVAQRGGELVGGAVREWAAQGRRTLAAEREAHDGPPELGDPEAVLDRLQELGQLVAEALADVGSVDASLDLEGNQLQLEVRAALREGAPFTERARSWPQAPHRFEAVPEGTALAYFRAGLPEGEDTLAEVLQEVAGERLGLAERDALAAVAEAVHGAPRTLAAGANDQGPFFFWRSRGVDLDAVGAPLRDAFRAGYLATLASTASGCEGSGARIAGRASGRCPAAPVSTLRGSTFVVATEGQRLLLDDGPADSVIARVTGDEPVVAALLLVPSSLPGTIGLVKQVPPIGDLPPGGAMLATLAIDDEGLRLRVRAASNAFQVLGGLLNVD